MKVVIIAVLLMLSAICSATETAFSSCNRIRLKKLADDGNKSAKKAMNICDNFDKALTAILVGNNVVNISSSSIATVLFTEKFGKGSVGLATVVMTVLVLIFGEILPKSLAKENSERFSILMAAPLSAFMFIITPITAIFMGIKSGVSKLVGNKNSEPSVTEEELKYIIDEIQDEGVLEEQESELVRQYAALSAQEELDVDAAADVYLELVKVRSQMTELAGSASYADYAYSAFYSRDYTPEDAQKIWQTAKEDFAPLLTKYSDALSQALSDSGISRTGGITDQNVIDALLYGTARMSPEVREAAEYLVEHSLYDISYSEKKLPTGYTSYLYSFDVPFIFNCPYDSYADYTDMFHEFGHWLAGYYHGSDALYGVIDYDLSELQSQGMEVMFLQFYEDLFGDDAEILRAQTLLNLVYSVVTGAMYDEFQQRIYAESDLTKDRLLDIYREVYASYGFEPYDGYEYEWTEVIHNFQQPLYYISYAVSAIPALELYARLAESPNDAMDTYLRVASMSDEDYFLTDALRETGLTNSMKSPIGDVIARELEESGAFDIS